MGICQDEVFKVGGAHFSSPALGIRQEEPLGRSKSIDLFILPELGGLH